MHTVKISNAAAYLLSLVLETPGESSPRHIIAAGNVAEAIRAEIDQTPAAIAAFNSVKAQREIRELPQYKANAVSLELTETGREAARNALRRGLDRGDLPPGFVTAEVLSAFGMAE